MFFSFQRGVIAVCHIISTYHQVHAHSCFNSTQEDFTKASLWMKDILMSFNFFGLDKLSINGNLTLFAVSVVPFCCQYELC